MRDVVRLIFTVRALLVSIAIVVGWLGLDRAHAADACGASGEVHRGRPVSSCVQYVSVPPEDLQYLNAVGSAVLLVVGLGFLLLAVHVIGSWRK